MLVIESQPDVLGHNDVRRPIRWTIRDDSYIQQPGENALIVLAFSNAGPGADGQSFTLLNTSFSTDSAAPYTASTFEYTADRQEAAHNFANMIRSNYAFIDWSVRVAEFPSGSAIVYIERGETGEVDAADFVNDISGVAPAIAPTYYEGQDEQVSEAKIWYQFWQDNTPISKRKVAGFDPTGRVVIDAQELARQILGVTSPYILWSSPVIDEAMSRRIYLRFGSYQSVDCERSFNQVYESASVAIVNSIVQYEYLAQSRPYNPVYSELVKWLSTRSGSFCSSSSSFDFLAVWLQASPGRTDGFFRVDYNYYDEDDELIQTVEKGVTAGKTIEGVLHVPAGALNPVVSSSVTAAASYWTIQVFVRNDDDLTYEAYSELIKVEKTDCSCKAAEIYYLEELGSWRSVVFEELDERTLEMGELRWQNPVQFNDAGTSPDAVRLFHDGGTYSTAQDVDRVYYLVSESITNSNRVKYEQFLASPLHFMLTYAEPLGYGTRRVMLPRGNYGVWKLGNNTKFVIPFRFNTPKKSR